MALDGTDVHPLDTGIVRDGHPRFSPDGSTIAYTGNGATGVEAVWRMAADGSDRRQLTSDSSHADVPTWSPDGAQLVFASTRTGNYEIYAMDADGSNERQLTDFPGNPNFFPLWSPGGQYVTFTRQLNDQGSIRKIFLMKADGTGLHQILMQFDYAVAFDWQPR